MCVVRPKLTLHRPGTCQSTSFPSICSNKEMQAGVARYDPLGSNAARAPFSPNTLHVIAPLRLPNSVSSSLSTLITPYEANMSCASTNSFNWSQDVLVYRAARWRCANGILLDSDERRVQLIVDLRAFFDRSRHSEKKIRV
jgi:hypothetical protein